jgi:hypothetical protein
VRAEPQQRPTTRQQSIRIRQHARAAVAFLDWLDAHDLALSDCRQADLDRWFTDDSGAYRKEVGHFIRWARTNELTTVRIAAVRWNGSVDPLDDRPRWDVARQLLHDDTIQTEDRLAGLFLLRYAQGATAISRMTASHVPKAAHQQ